MNVFHQSIAVEAAAEVLVQAGLRAEATYSELDRTARRGDAVSPRRRCARCGERPPDPRRAPEGFADHHDTSAFTCRSSEQTDWLRRHARQSARSGTTKVFVLTEDDGGPVVAYYGWCMAQLAPAAAPARLTKGAGRYPQPVALLARLGVHTDHQRRGLGAALLQDVFLRLSELSDEIGCRGLLVHAESSEARDFYLHLVPEFKPSPSDDLHLVLLMKDIRRTLR